MRGRGGYRGPTTGAGRLDDLEPLMHHPRCLDPATQTGEHPHALEGGCYLGASGHCDKCPHRGQRDSRFSHVMLLGGYVGRRPDTVFVGGHTTPQEVANVLWPLDERSWIARDDCWDERATYHFNMARNELLRELLREIHDLRGAKAGVSNP